MNEQVVILDFGSQYTQVIARRIRECKVYSIILHYNTPASEIAAMKPKGIILSGGPSSVYSRKAPLPDKKIFELGIPILGICFGLQVMAKFLNGKVERGQKRAALLQGRSQWTGTSYCPWRRAFEPGGELCSPIQR